MATVAPTTKKGGLSQVSMIFACGTALFSDGYANSIIGSVNTLLKRIYGKTAVKATYTANISSLAFAGTILGMLSFGYISDKVGRKTGMMTATGIVAFFSLLSAGSAGHGLGGLFAMLAACRFFLGIGIGAEYPCGSVAASEQTEGPGIAKNAQHRWFALATNAMIDWGFVIGAFVPLVLYWIFGNNHLRAVWRVSLGLGFFPAAAVLLWRLKMQEPVAYRRNSMRNARTPYWLIVKRYWAQLAAISITWFIYDWITYPFGIYSTIIVDEITNSSDSLSVVFGWNVVINLFYIPGTMLGAFIIDYLGPKYTMIFGLLMQAVFGFIMSGLYDNLVKHVGAFAVVYGIFLSFGEVGPGNNLGLLASKTSPTAIRGQFYGIAAAIGKVGAFIGTYSFPSITDQFAAKSAKLGITGPFWVASGLAILSALITFFFIRPLDHDGMAAEDEKFREYLEANGYDTSLMGTGEIESVNQSHENIDEKVGAEHEKVGAELP